MKELTAKQLRNGVVNKLWSYGSLPKNIQEFMGDEVAFMLEIIDTKVKEQLRIGGVVKSLPSKETIISEAIKYQDEFLDDPHSIADEAFIEGCNFILTALMEDKIVR